MGKSDRSRRSSEAANIEPEQQPRVHTLSMRLTAAQYRRLRRFVTQEEEQIGRRISYQVIVETALDEFLGRRGR